MTEIWQPVVGYETLYQVSSLGRVRRMLNRSGNPLREPLILQLITRQRGYLNVNLWKQNRHHSRRVHRVVMAAFIGPVPEGMQVNHRNGIKTDNSLDNLEYVSPAENVRHAKEVLHVNQGERHPSHRLSDMAVRHIRTAVLEGRSKTELARDFGVSGRCIGDVIRNRSWRHVR